MKWLPVSRKNFKKHRHIFVWMAPKKTHRWSCTAHHAYLFLDSDGRWLYGYTGDPVEPHWRVTHYLIPTKPEPSPGRASKRGKAMKSKNAPAKAAKKPKKKKAK